jgi:HK97 family phage major capsid protein
MLKYEVPISWHDGSAYYMNQLALLQSMSSAEGRPLFGQFGTSAPGAGLSFAGSPIIINSWMPDVGPGATPVMFGNLRRAYTLVERRGVTVEPDPYTAAWCMLYKFSARLGGATTCSNALRLLRIR